MLHQLLEFLQSFKDPTVASNWIFAHGGLYVVMLIIFAETGLFAGFFLPGDSLLFITGIIISNIHSAASSVHPMFSHPAPDLLYWIALISFAGFIGNILGYWIGRESGHLLFEKRDTWLFKRKHLIRAHDYYEKKGGVVIILARFIPIVRTFTPVVAGIVKMSFRKFTSYSLLGAIGWVMSMILAGFWLGKIKWVQTNIEWIVISLIVVTTIPVLIRMVFVRKKPLPAGENPSSK
jgi:membrane-associated protein